MYIWFFPVIMNAYLTVVVFSCFFLLAGALIITVFLILIFFFKSFATVKIKCKQVKTPLTCKNTKKICIYNFVYPCNLSYVPYLCSILIFLFIQDYGKAGVTFDVCAAVVFFFLVFQSLAVLLEEKRNWSVNSIIRKLFCSQIGERRTFQ